MARRTKAQKKAARAAPPAHPRRGLVLREVRGEPSRSYYEVSDPGALEAIKDKLTQSEFDAGLRLRSLWRSGCLNGEATSSPISRIGLGRVSFFDAAEPDDHKLEANDELRPLIRVMGMFGDLAVAVAAYDRRVGSSDELDWLREALGRLASYLSGERRGRRDDPMPVVGEPGPADAAPDADADYISGEALRRRLVEMLG